MDDLDRKIGSREKKALTGSEADLKTVENIAKAVVQMVQNNESLQ